MSQVQVKSQVLMFDGEIPLSALIEALSEFRRDGYLSCALEMNYRFKGAKANAAITLWSSHPGAEEED